MKNTEWDELEELIKTSIVKSGLSIKEIKNIISQCFKDYEKQNKYAKAFNDLTKDETKQLNDMVEDK